MHETQVNVHGNVFRLSMADGAVCLFNSALLENFLRKSSYAHALRLAIMIKVTYETYFSKPLEVSEDSIAVEILGHVYFEDFMETLGNKIPLKIMDTLYEKIRSHCQEINVGEKGQDHNRFFWDLVTPLVKKYFH